MKIGLKLKRIAYAGASVGRDIRVEVEILDKSLRIEKRIAHGTTVEFNNVIGVFEVGQSGFEAEIAIKVTERDLLFSDTGKTVGVVRIDDLASLPRVFEYTVSVIERRRLFWKRTASFLAVVEAYDAGDGRIPVKTYRSSPGEDYNRYDTIIEGVTDYWSNEFAHDTDPPAEPLDPNLVKAIIYQESRVGNDENGKTNIMQVGNAGDASLKTLRGELPEYWIHHGEQILLRYDANVETVRDSVYWGVRWLYHKAQYIGFDGQRHWNSWKEAVHEYGPNKKEYTENVWSIYTKGLKKEKNRSIILWTLLLLCSLVIPAFLKYDKTEYIKRMVLRVYHHEQRPADNVAVTFSRDQRGLFLAVLEREVDWWEDLHIGRLNGREVNWIEMADLPTEQSILSARFVALKGISDPVLEVYGKTHVGHGNIYLYRVGDHQLSLLLRTVAVDSYNESVWRPDGYPEYGYATCGHIYKGERLLADYRDENGDDVADVVLNGNVEVICENVTSYDPFVAQDITVAELPVHEIHFLHVQ